MRVKNLLATVALTALSAIGLGFSGPAQAQSPWTLIPLYTDPATGQADVPLAINDAGWMTGAFYYDAYYDQEGFLRDPNGVYTNFDVGGDAEVRGIGLNNVVVGATYVGPGGNDVNAFSRAADGTITWLLNPGTGLPLDGFAQGQNAKGDIVGDYLTGPDGVSGAAHGFILNGASFTDLSFPGSSKTKARGINDNGVVVGYETTGSVTSGFIYDHGTWTSYNYPGNGDVTVFEDINNNGLIVGQWDGLGSGGYSIHSFLYDPSTQSLQDLTPPDHGLYIQAFSVNNLDQVLVQSDNNWIFNADAVPEPGAWTLMFSALGAVGAMARRRRLTSRSGWG